MRLGASSSGRREATASRPTRPPETRWRRPKVRPGLAHLRRNQQTPRPAAGTPRGVRIRLIEPAAEGSAGTDAPRRGPRRHRLFHFRRATSAPDANIGSICGIGFPVRTDGVLQYVNQYPGGLTGFLARARGPGAACGSRFVPPDSLVRRAAAGSATSGPDAADSRRPSAGPGLPLDHSVHRAQQQEPVQRHVQVGSNFARVLGVPEEVPPEVAVPAFLLGRPDPNLRLELDLALRIDAVAYVEISGSKRRWLSTAARIFSSGVVSASRAATADSTCTRTRWAPAHITSSTRSSREPKVVADRRRRQRWPHRPDAWRRNRARRGPARQRPESAAGSAGTCSTRQSRAGRRWPLFTGAGRARRSRQRDRHGDGHHRMLRSVRCAAGSWPLTPWHPARRPPGTGSSDGVAVGR